MRYFPKQNPPRQTFTREEYFAHRKKARRMEYLIVCALGIGAAWWFMMANGGFQ